MRLDQDYGYNEDGKKIVGKHSSELRERGVVGTIYREQEIYNPKTKTYDLLIEVSRCQSN